MVDIALAEHDAGCGEFIQRQHRGVREIEAEVTEKRLRGIDPLNRVGTLLGTNCSSFLRQLANTVEYQPSRIFSAGLGTDASKIMPVIWRTGASSEM